jgi:hypothetical protein
MDVEGCSLSSGEDGGGDCVLSDGGVVVDELLVLTMLRGMEAGDVAALELVKTRLRVSMRLKEMPETGLNAGTSAGAGVSAL